jgi:hypothetical protein
MKWWIYKCNSRQHPDQVVYGDWRDFFDKGRIAEWGSTEWVPALELLTRGDMVIAYQTDRNELVGLTSVHSLRRRSGYFDLFLEPLEEIGVKVRPLKKLDPIIAAIPALQSGPIKTVYDISPSDAQALLRAAGSRYIGTEPGTVSEKDFLEGEKRATATTVRNAQLRIAAKEHWGFTCYCCGFDFAQFYGAFATGSAIVHHLEIFASGAGKRRRSTLEDVRVICANCHYVIHRTDPPMDVDELKSLIAESWNPWSRDGITRKSPSTSGPGSGL